MWEFWVLPIPIIFLSKSTDTDPILILHMSSNYSLYIPCIWLDGLTTYIVLLNCHSISTP